MVVVMSSEKAYIPSVALLECNLRIGMRSSHRASADVFFFLQIYTKSLGGCFEQRQKKRHVSGIYEFESYQLGSQVPDIDRFDGDLKSNV